MVNAAHASDSEENATREIKIVNVAENNIRKVVEQFEPAGSVPAA
jgi:hypothetical protein